MQSPYLLILGATSTIARACARRFARAGFNLCLAGRDLAELARTAADIQVRYHVSVHCVYLDVEDFASHPAFFAEALQKCAPISGVLSAVGYLVDSATLKNHAAERKVIDTNFTGVVNLLTLIKHYFSAQRQGFIICITSVAGDRGRQSNYVYGAAKAGLATYLQGLRNELHAEGIRVITVKPGFVDTRMTFGKPGLFCVAAPEFIAEKIVTALNQRADVIYLPGVWRYIMLIIKLIPEFIFKRLHL